MNVPVFNEAMPFRSSGRGPHKLGCHGHGQKNDRNPTIILYSFLSVTLQLNAIHIWINKIIGMSYATPESGGGGRRFHISTSKDKNNQSSLALCLDFGIARITLSEENSKNILEMKQVRQKCKSDEVESVISQRQSCLYESLDSTGSQ